MSSEDGMMAGAGRRFVEDTSISGVRRAARPGIFFRVIWIIVIIVATGMTVYSLIRLYNVRSQRSQLMTSGLDDARSQEFPAVTICNVNPVVLSSLYSKGFLESDALSKWQSFLSSMSSQSAQSEAENKAARLEYQTLVDQLSPDQRMTAGHDLQSMLVDCRLGDAPCSVSNFSQFYHHKYGNCYTFTADEGYQQIFSTGAQYGLTLDLVTGSSEYAIEDEAGFVVTVHEPRDTIFPPEEGVFVPEGMAAHVAITKKTDTTSAGGNCVDDSSNDNNIYAVSTGWKYSQRGCLRGCLQKALYSQCGCCDLDLPCPTSFLRTASPLSMSLRSSTTLRRCSARMERCWQEVMRRYTDGSLSCISECKPRCSETSYRSQVSYTTLLRNQQSQPVDLPSFTRGMTEQALTRLPTRKEENVEGNGSGSESRSGFPTQGPTSLPTTQDPNTQIHTDISTESPVSDPLTPDLSTFTPRLTEGSGDGPFTNIPQEFRETPPVFSDSETPPPVNEEAPPRFARSAVVRRKRQTCIEGAYGGIEGRQIPCIEDPVSATSGSTDRVRVHVYFQDFRAHFTQSVDVNDWSEWFADIGGITSLWLGLSVLGLLELVHMVAELSFMACFKSCGGGNSNGTPTRVKPLEP